jgi:hypothetical protein
VPKRAEAAEEHQLDEPSEHYEGNLIVPGSEWEPVRAAAMALGRAARASADGPS